jgi:hypothetical protein
MGKFPFIIESEDIIGTGFYGSIKNIGPAAINIYSLVEVMFHYKRLHQVLSLLLLCCLLVIYLLVFSDTPALNLRVSVNCNTPSFLINIFKN